MPRATLQTVADVLGVSRTTVSNAYSRPEKLSVQLREEILATARRLGYDGPSPLAASLRTGRTDTIGVLLTDDLRYAFTDPVASMFLAGVAGQAQDAGYAVTVLSAPRGGGPGAVRTAMADGLIVYSVDDDSPALPVVRSRGLPAVFVDQAPGTGDAVSVSVDDRAGAAAAMAHLLGLGHRRVAAIGVGMGPDRCAPVPVDAISTNHVARERTAGWLAACADAGGPPPLLVSCPANGAGYGRDAARLLFAGATEGPRPTAVACLSDELALGVIAELAALGIDVPAQVSVVGFDDSPAAARAHPPLTTMHQSVLDKGDLAARLLLDRLRSASADPARPAAAPRTHRLPVRLVVRSSTAPPPTP